jgi:type I restriction enzyme S subunit
MGVRMKQVKQGLVPKLRFREFEKDGEWEEKKVEELFNLQDGYAFSSNEFIDNPINSFQVIRITDINNHNKNRDKIYIPIHFEGESEFKKYIAKKGDLLLSLTGAAGFNFFIWNSNPAIINQRTMKISLKDESNNALKVLLSPLIYDKINAHGSGQNNNLSKESLRGVNFLIPKPAEQQKIADCLSSLDELIEAEDQKLEALQRHKKGLMQELFPADGETLPRLRFPEFQSAPEWEEKPFSNFIKLYRGSSPRPIQEFLTKNNDGVNWIKIGDTKFSSNFIIGKVEEKITKKGAERSRFVEIGELILANSMSYGKTYQLAINGCIYDGWFVLREYEDFFYKPFLLQLLNSDFMQKQYESLSAGGIVQNISSEVVYSSKLFHTSIPEQARIADFLISIDEIINTQTKKLESLRLHKKGLMQQLFPNHNQEEIINHNKP